MYLKQSSSRKLFLCVMRRCVGGWWCFNLLAKLWFHFDNPFFFFFLSACYPNTSWYLLSQMLLFDCSPLSWFLHSCSKMPSPCTMEKQHVLVIRGLSDSHVWGLRRSGKDVDACRLHVHYDIYCSVYHTTKKGITIRSCPRSCYRISSAMFTPSQLYHWCTSTVNTKYGLYIPIIYCITGPYT